MLKAGEQGKEWGGRGAGWGVLLLGNTDRSMGGERGKGGGGGGWFSGQGQGQGQHSG